MVDSAHISTFGFDLVEIGREELGGDVRCCVLTAVLKRMTLLHLLSEDGELRKVHSLGPSCKESLTEV